MRVASRLGGEDLERGKGCIRDVGRLRWEEAGNGGLFSITRPWPVQRADLFCGRTNKTKLNTSRTTEHVTCTRHATAARDTPT